MSISDNSLNHLDSSYYADAARQICELANVSTTIITECIGYSNISVKTLAIYHNNKFVDNMHYDVVDTPCDKVVEGDTCFYPSGIQKLFPKDKDLVNLNAESYCAVPLINNSQEVAGHLFILHDKPLENKAKYLSILEPFSKKIAIELERKQNESIFNSLVNAFNIRQGEHFFSNLAKHIQEILNADYVFISELLNIENNKASSLAAIHRGKTIDQIEYDLSGTPCEEVVNKSATSFSSGVQNKFPGFQFLENINAESYVGSLLMNNDGKSIGLISVINTAKISNLKTYESLINIFAARAADELNRRAIEQDLKDSKDQFQTLYDDTPAMFFNTDSNGVILQLNKYGSKHLGYQVNELIGKNIHSIIHKDDLENAEEKLKQCFALPDTVHRWQVKKVHKDGHTIMARESVRVVANKQGSPTLFIACEDISEAFRLSEQISYQATHDNLTGLTNRSEFERRLKRVIEANRIEPEEHVICYLDLDQFKVINDTCGHLAGDELLRQLSDLLLTRVRKRDTLARLGGDEFGVLMEHCDIEHAQVVSESLRKIVEEFRFVWEHKKFSIGVSIGLVPISVEIGNVNEVLSAADAACYAAKDAGRNRVHLFSIDDKLVSQHRGEMQWVLKINEALEENLFTLFHQKIMAIKPGKNEGDHYELLIRMKTKSGETIPPGSFLPAAERYGLATKIDRWVINSTFSWLTTYPDKLSSLDLFNINLSGQSLSDEEFMDYLDSKLNENHAIANKICFEITETTAVANLTKAMRFIEKVKEKGCCFALDDFGSGVSSFGYLRSLPVDYLKIDGAFVRDIVTDRIDRAMVKSINEIGQLMGKKTIAEFVENDAILKELEKLGVDYVQGYGIGKPEELI